MKFKNIARLYVTGFVMGTADIIPGVSGGTIAFISGIYEELLTAIKTVTGTTLGLLVRFRLREAYNSVPFRFLLPLGLGLATALFSLAGLLTYLLENHSAFVWAFFFGLVGASTYIVAKRVVRWTITDYVAFIGAAVFAFLLVGGSAIQLPHTAVIIFLSGAIAICAMILPGISGSFILVLLGQYTHVLASVTNFDFVTLGIFSLGTLVGISFFSRILSWLFAHHHDVSVAILSGFMLGSLRKIWPFAGGDASMYLSVRIWLLIALGAAIVLVLTKYHALKERTEDIAVVKHRV
jgi:putative membrane protein